MKVSTKLASLSRMKSGGGPAQAGPPSGSSGGRCDVLVRAVRLDLEDVEPAVQRVIRLRRETEAAAEDRVLHEDLLDVPCDVAPVFDLAVARVAGPLDGVERNLNREV